jgi:hypothetical protein
MRMFHFFSRMLAASDGVYSGSTCA